jgi:hypothetical protein
MGSSLLSVGRWPRCSVISHGADGSPVDDPVISRCATVLSVFIACLLVYAGSLVAYADAQELRFSFEAAHSSPNQDGPKELWLRGEIAEGDAHRMTAYLRGHPAEFLESGGTIHLNIDGGDVLEAWALGKLIRDAMMDVRVTDSGRTRCTSACFFIFVSAASRLAVAGTVGIHRPHIDQQTLARSTPAPVRERYETLMADTAGKLEKLQVPRDIVESMMRTPPGESYWLSADELRRIGELAPWFDDYASAKCAIGAGLHERMREAKAASYELEALWLEEQWQAATKCFDGLRRVQRQRLLDDWNAAR